MKHVWLKWLGPVIVLLIVAFLAFRWLQRPELYGIWLDSEQPAADFTLMSAGDQPIRLSDYRGKVVLLYFGYTHCPDACPTTMAETKVAFAELGEQAVDVAVIMISVDPERDTPAILAEYVQQFDPRFVGGTLPLDEVTALASAYGVIFRKQEGSVATGYLLEHSTQLIALDRQGYTRMILPYGLRGEEMADDLRYLLSF
jgi:protein SCO1/2